MSAADARVGHPSALALDRHALGIAPPEIAAHIAGCEACRARVGDTTTAPLAVPTWARRLGPRRVGWLGSWSRTSRVPRGVAVAVAAFACVALVWGASRREGERRAEISGGDLGGYLGAKGAPEVRLFIKRGARVELWDPSVPVVEGDLLRLEIQPALFAHVSVFEAAPAPGAYTRLYDAAITPRRPTALPASWRVDAQPGDETLVVVLSPGPVAADEVARLLTDDDGGRSWTRRLVVAKANDKRGAAP